MRDPDQKGGFGEGPNTHKKLLGAIAVLLVLALVAFLWSKGMFAPRS
jgi:hypothetical protein